MTSDILSAFRVFQTELDGKHDKYERLVKLSRDVTITSKRIIFSIHRMNESDQENCLDEIGEKLADLERTKLKAVAHELLDEDPFRFIRAYSPGLQEYIEAVALWHFAAKRSIISLESVQERLTFAQRSSAEAETTTPDGEPHGPAVTESTTSVYIPPAEYVLGICDVTGELMRIAVHSVGVGDKTTPYVICQTMQELVTALSSLYGIARDLPQKLSTLRQSVSKVESACYAIHVRGSELPDHLLTSVLSYKPTAMPSDDVKPIDVD